MFLLSVLNLVGCGLKEEMPKIITFSHEDDFDFDKENISLKIFVMHHSLIIKILMDNLIEIYRKNQLLLYMTTCYDRDCISKTCLTCSIVKNRELNRETELLGNLL